MEPREAPKDTAAVENSEPAILTLMVLSDKFDLNKLSVVPQIPTWCCGHELKMLWSTVSKAVVKLSRIRPTCSTNSIA